MTAPAPQPTRVTRELSGRIEPASGDGELVLRARAGSRFAEEALYHRYVRDVTRIVIRLLARRTEAEDVVQDTFVTAFQGLAQLEDPDAFKPWLYRIAVHQVHRRFRKRKLLRFLGLDRGVDDATLAEQVDPAASPETRTLLGEVDRLLDTLPTRARIAWILRYVEGQDLESIAQACGCSLATVKRSLSLCQSTVLREVDYERRSGGAR